VRNVVMWLLSPLSWALLATVVGLAAWPMRGRARWLWRGCIAVLLFSLLAMTPLLANALLWYLERMEPLAASATCHADAPDTVVILAGGIDQRPRDRNDFSVLSAASRRRLDSGVAYWRGGPERTLIITGGPAKPGWPAESVLLSAYAASLGVPASALRLETQATNTWENAQRLTQMQPAIASRVMLATSAAHMTRARLAFRVAGFDACPLPSDYRFTPNDFPQALLPRSSALAKSEMAIHELVGLIFYRLRELRRAASDSD